MNRIGSFILTAFALAAFSAAGATVDGKWTGEGKARTKQGEQTVSATFDFKADAGKLTGTVTMGKGKRAQPMEIKDGKVEGEKVSFTTTVKARKGDRPQSWDGTIKEGQIEMGLSAGKKGKARVTMTLKRAA